VETMIVSDSLLSIQLVTGEANPKENIDLVESCRTMWKYKPKVSFQWVKGHEDHKGNLLADELADEAIRGSERIVHHEPKEP
jgi:ribonuclease HI